MLQVVCMKQVPDPQTRVRVAADGKSLDGNGVTWVMSPYEEYAFEQALRLKDALGAGEVVALSLGGPGVATMLRTALAVGADRAVHLRVDAAQPDPLQVARALAEELRELKPALIWFGKKAVDDDQGQVGAMVGELLGLPCVTAVAKVTVAGDRVSLERETETGHDQIEAPLPCVITVSDMDELRHASLKGIMAAKKKPLLEKPAVLGEPTLEVVAMALPPERAAGRIVGEGAGAVPELVRLLREEAKVL